MKLHALPLVAALAGLIPALSGCAEDDYQHEAAYPQAMSETVGVSTPPPAPPAQAAVAPPPAFRPPPPPAAEPANEEELGVANAPDPSLAASGYEAMRFPLTSTRSHSGSHTTRS